MRPKYNYLDQRRKEMNAPLNKIRKEGNKELREKAMEMIRMEKTQLPRKHVGKSTTAKQELVIDQIKEDLKLGTTLEAKHEYFENQEKYDKRQGTKIVKLPGIALDEFGIEKEDIKAVTEDIKKRQPEEPKKGSMIVENTKIGVTMVLSKEDCKTLGFMPGTHTKQVISETRKKLGLPEKKSKGR